MAGVATEGPGAGKGARLRAVCVVPLVRLLGGVADLARRRGRYEASARLFHAGRAIAERWLGPAHP